MAVPRLISTPVRRCVRFRSRTPSVVRRLLFVTATLGALSIGSMPGTVSAQTTLTSSDPANGAELITSPTQITATFSAAVPNNAVMTMACNSVATPLGTVTIGTDGVSLIAPVTSVLPVGTCTVSFSIPETDGKVTFGSFSFEVLDPTGQCIAVSQPLTHDSAADPACRAPVGWQQCSSAEPPWVQLRFTFREAQLYAFGCGS